MDASSSTAAVAAAYKDFGALIADANVMPTWSPDGSCAGFVTGPRDRRQAWRVDLATGAKTPLVDVATLRQAVFNATGVTPPGQGVPFEHFAFLAPTLIFFAIGADKFTYDLTHNLAILAPAPSALDTYLGMTAEARATPRAYKRTTPLIDPTDAYETPSPDGKWLLSIRDYNVSLRATIDGRSQPLTRDGTRELEWNVDWANPMLAMLGLAAPVTTWSPQANRIAAYRIDQRGVFQSPQVHYLQRDEELVSVPFVKAGGVLEKLSLFVLDVAGRAPVQIQLGDTTDKYPCFAGWLPDGSGLLVLVMSRDCRRVEIHAADPVTGATRLLFTEEGKSFVRIHHDIYYGRKTGLTLTPDGKHLLWLSERDGWQHLYQYDLQGQLVARLTQGEWAVRDVVRVIGNDVYFMAYPDRTRPYDAHLCKAPLGGGPLKVLTEGPGKHACLIAPFGNAFFDTVSAPARPPVTALRKMDGTVLNAEVWKADISKLQQAGFAAPEQFSVKAADGTTDLWGVMYKPFDFDPQKKYPVVEWIYGGPQMAVAEHGFTSATLSMGGMALQLAQQGYVVVTLDARGTPGRSKAFHDACYGSYCGTLTADHAAALRNLAARHPYLDLARVGITGGSWGAYSTFRCLVEQPDLYKAGVAVAPGFDPLSCVLYECYLGLPQDNPEGYRKADLFALAPQLKGELMIMGGTADHATWPDAMKMSEALIRAGKLHDFVVMPDQYHAFDSVHYDYQQRAMARFFGRHLKGAA